MLQIGSRVKYTHENTKEEKALGYYPPVGTLGTVTDVNKFAVKVKWDKGTIEGKWLCPKTDIKEVLPENPTKEFYSDLRMEQTEQM